MSNNLLSQISSKENKIVKLDQNIIYDIIIIGAGPAGLTAAVYCMRKGIKTGLITLNIGGQLIETAGIENYMGFRYIEGYQLVEKFKEQVKQFEIGFNEGVKVSSISNDKVKKIYLEDGSIYKTKAIIIASGKSSRKLNVPGENNFMGRGVAFCATCDAPLYKGKNVAVVGGGNSGLEAVLDLAKIVKHVTIIQNLDKFTADEMLINNLKNYNNIDILYNSEVKEIIGDKNVTSIIVKNKKNQNLSKINIDGLFIEIGLVPNSDFVKGILALNKYNEITVDCACRTNIPGIFAAGDVTSVLYKQIIIAAGEGAKAALIANEYILKGN